MFFEPDRLAHMPAKTTVKLLPTLRVLQEKTSDLLEFEKDDASPNSVTESGEESTRLSAKPW